MIIFVSFHIVGFDFKVTTVGDNYESCTFFFFMKMAMWLKTNLDGR